MTTIETRPAPAPAPTLPEPGVTLRRRAGGAVMIGGVVGRTLQRRWIEARCGSVAGGDN